MSEGLVSKERYLGESVFCIGGDGRITRTVVSALSVPRNSEKKVAGDGSVGDLFAGMDAMLDRVSYSLLNHHDGRYWFSLEDAIRDAIPILEKYMERTDISRSIVESTREYLAMIQTGEGQGAILSQPLIEGSRGVFQRAAPINPDMMFPSVYFKPGETVFCLITPATPYTLVPAWRPHYFFILETTVIEVRYAPSWPARLWYQLEGTHYHCSHGALARTEAEARMRLAEVFTAETEGTIDPTKLNLVPVATEAAYWEEVRRMKPSERYRRAP